MSAIVPLAESPLTAIAGYDPKATEDVGKWFYDQKKADLYIEFIQTQLSHVKDSRYTAAKAPFLLEPWQDLATRLIFGVVDKDGLRRYRTMYCEIPRKNGKSTWVAALATASLFLDGEQGAECYCAAADRDQASLLYGMVSGMIRNNRMLNSATQIRPSQKIVRYGESYLKALSSDAGTKHGFNSHFVCADELHTWPKRDLYDVLKTSQGARRQPFMAGITTAGNSKESFCFELHQYAERVKTGEVDDARFLPLLYYAPEGADWKDEEVWKAANPNWGVSLSEDYMRDQCKEAEANPSYENTFRNLHLNQWTSQTVRWLQMSKWDKCEDTGPITKGDGPVYVGLDLSTTTDLTSACFLQRTPDATYRLEWLHFMPAGRVLRAEKEDRVPYSKWEKDGWLVVTPGERVDYNRVYDEVVAKADELGVHYVGYDPWNAEALAQRFSEAGFTAVAVRQGYQSLSEPSKNLEALVAEGRWWHGNSPIVRWQADNVEIMIDPNGNIRPTKDQGTRRIDGIVSSIIALAVEMAAPAAEDYSFYEDSGLEMM